MEPGDRRAMYREDIERSAFGNKKKKENAFGEYRTATTSLTTADGVSHKRVCEAYSRDRWNMEKLRPARR